MDARSGDPTPADEDFIHNLHKALHNLYEPYLQRDNPLVEALGLNKQTDVATALRKILLDAIHALKPDSIVPSDSGAWRIFQVLSYRFEEQYSQEEVASQMAVSPRQVRRMEFVAIRALASYLVEHDIVHLHLSSPALDESSLAESGQRGELEWLKKTYAREVLTIDKLLDSILETSAPLLKSYNRQISVELTPGILPVMGQLVTLRQAFLTSPAGRHTVWRTSRHPHSRLSPQ